MINWVIICCLLALWPQSTFAKRTEMIGRNKKYFVRWEVDKINETIIFEVLVETTGFVGFGISKNGGMAGSDIIIGGINPDGTVYFSDRHGTFENGYPPLDKQQDWDLIEAKENATHTYLQISRPINTCDPEDVEITSDTLRFIWAMGKDDTIAYHESNRGSNPVSILGEPYPEVDLTQFESFEVTTTVTLPAKRTTYWCTVHKGPVFSSYQHAIAFGPVHKSVLSETHSHHLSLYTCTAPKGKDPQEFFDRYITQGGIDCLDRKPCQIFAYPYCTKLIYTWTIGGRIMLMPDNVGFPIGLHQHEYYLMESHFDNPENLVGVTFESGVQIFHTPTLRPIEAGVMRIGQMYSYNLVVPPDSKDYMIVGRCSPDCTKEYVPEEGVNIFNVMLHSHTYGSKMRFRQFRNGTELPWVINDENYNLDYQENRNIPTVKLFPGDQMAIECWYNNQILNPPATVIGGFGTDEEMCEVVFYYYPKMELENCRSAIPFKTVLDRFGIEKVKKVRGLTNPLILSPPELAGKRFLEYVDSLTWTQEDINSLETLLLFGNHIEECGGVGFQRSLNNNPLQEVDHEPSVEKQLMGDVTYITYPEIYQDYNPPPNECSKKH